MNCLILNVRGIGKEYKVAWVNELKVKHRSSYLGVQEIRLSDVNGIDVEGYWDHSEFGFVTTPSSGRSGGILSMWDACMYNVEEVIKTRHFLITIGRCTEINGAMIFANIYVPHKPQEEEGGFKNDQK